MASSWVKEPSLPVRGARIRPIWLLAAPILLGWLAVGLGACGGIGGRTIVVEFSDAGGVRGGEAVYISGVRVGETDSPSVAQGQVQVRVRLLRKHKDSVAPGTVFLIKKDPEAEQRVCLIGYAVGAGKSPEAEAPPATYRGAGNELELALILGAEMARQVWNQLSE